MPIGRPWRRRRRRSAKVPAAERRFLMASTRHLHEATVGGATLDLLDGEFGSWSGTHDRGAQSRLRIEPFLDDPVVERAREGPAMSSLNSSPTP